MTSTRTERAPGRSGEGGVGAVGAICPSPQDLERVHWRGGSIRSAQRIDRFGWERKRLQKEVSKFQGWCAEWRRSWKQGFLENAPPEVVDKEHKRRHEYEANLANLEACLDLLGSHN